MLGTFAADVEKGKNDATSIFYKRELGKSKITPNNGLRTHPALETGTAKMQNGRCDKMTDSKTEACRVLESSDGVRGSTSDEDSSDGTHTQQTKRRKNRRKKIKPGGTSKCVDCNFIVGSCAEVEGLWFKAGAALTKRRKGMAPTMLEAIIFLKKIVHFGCHKGVSE